MFSARRGFLMMTAGLLACGSETTAPEPSGNYRLSRVDNTPLPSVIALSASDTMRTMSGTLTLDARRYSVEIIGNYTTNGATIPSVQQRSGTYAVSGSSVSFTDAIDGVTVSGSIDNSSLRVTSDGHVWVFERR